jgi:hypothetical protein
MPAGAAMTCGGREIDSGHGGFERELSARDRDLQFIDSQTGEVGERETEDATRDHLQCYAGITVMNPIGAVRVNTSWRREPADDAAGNRVEFPVAPCRKLRYALSSRLVAGGAAGALTVGSAVVAQHDTSIGRSTDLQRAAGVEAAREACATAVEITRTAAVGEFRAFAAGNRATAAVRPRAASLSANTATDFFLRARRALALSTHADTVAERAGN